MALFCAPHNQNFKTDSRSSWSKKGEVDIFSLVNIFKTWVCAKFPHFFTNVDTNLNKASDMCFSFELFWNVLLLNFIPNFYSKRTENVFDVFSYHMLALTPYLVATFL